MSGQRLLHVAIADDWEACQRFGEYDVSTHATSLESAGFIHAATLPQLPAVLRDVYGDVALPLVLAVIDEEALASSGVEVSWESPATRPGGDLVPRIKGPVPMDADTVVAEIVLERHDGQWEVPDLAGLSVRVSAPAVSERRT